MSTRPEDGVFDATTYTTNAEDQAEAAKLQARLEFNEKAAAAADPSSTDRIDGPQLNRPAWASIPSVTIADGAHKYVLVSATEPAPRYPAETCLRREFVVSRRGAAYHRNAAEPLICTLEQHGFRDIRVNGETPGPLNTLAMYQLLVRCDIQFQGFLLGGCISFVGPSLNRCSLKNLHLQAAEGYSSTRMSAKYPFSGTPTGSVRLTIKNQNQLSKPISGTRNFT